MCFRHTILLTAILAAGPAFAQTEPDNAAEPAAAGASATATAELQGADGASHGTVTLTQTNAGVLVRAELTGLPPGPHGFHFHETGLCEPPFESAGGHYNPTNVNHGYMAEGGPHVGDLPNVTVPETGDVTIEHLNAFVSLSPDSGNTLLDEDGTAIVVHAGADDYQSQPSGESGDRIACGVVAQ
jgi:Cu-Zn family superoxide dismutase